MWQPSLVMQVSCDSRALNYAGLAWVDDLSGYGRVTLDHYPTVVAYLYQQLFSLQKHAATDWEAFCSK